MCSDPLEKNTIKLILHSAGVSGLTTALLLSKNPRYHVTIVAKHMPGDYDIEYTSPWAGANYLPSVCPFLPYNVRMINGKVGLQMQLITDGRRTHGQSLPALQGTSLKPAFISKVIGLNLLMSLIC